MSNLSYTRPLGVWNSGAVYAIELQDLDRKSVKAPNFAEGGTYAPSSAVIVGGSGMNLKLVGVNTMPYPGEFNIAGTLRVSGFSEFSGENSFTGENSFFGAGKGFWYTGTVETFFDGSTLQFGGAFAGSAGGSMNLGAGFNFDCSGVANFAGTLRSLGTFALSGTTNIGGVPNVTADLTLTGAGTIVERVVTGPNADATFSVSTTDIVYIKPGTFTASRTYFLDEIGAVNGKKITFHTEANNTDFPLTLKRSVDGSTICLLTWDASGFVWTSVLRIGGVWRRYQGQMHGG